MEASISTQCKIVGRFGPDPFVSGASVDWGFLCPSVTQVIEAVCGYYGIRKIDLISERKTKEVLTPRQVAMYLARELTIASFPKLGRVFGGRDHSTVMHSYAKTKERIETDPELRTAVDALVAALGGRQ